MMCFILYRIALHRVIIPYNAIIKCNNVHYLYVKYSQTSILYDGRRDQGNQ